MRKSIDAADQFKLRDGAKIAVIGGGPSGSFFSIFANKMAKMIDKELDITIFEPKNFTKDGPLGCNRCGGVISELLLQTLAVEGIDFPESVVQRGINSYRLHTNHGSAYIATPSFEKTIATVYRGGGPKGVIGKEKDSFDKFLLDMAVIEGAVHKPVRIDRVDNSRERPELFSGDQKIMEADLVVGAFGVNSPTFKMFEDIGFGYKRPKTATTAIAEISLDMEKMSDELKDTIHLFLLPLRNIKFAAMIPKGTHLTLCILGDNMNAGSVKDFLSLPIVREVLPGMDYDVKCSCLPRMNTGAPKIPYADRIVTCGDSGSTRLFKDGIGAAYEMGKAAAKTAVFSGVGRQHFQSYYYPVYKDIIFDNLFGRYLFGVIDLYKYFKIMTIGMVEVVKKEQMDADDSKVLSSVLWDMFTGNERYKNIAWNAIDLKMHLRLWKEFAKALTRGRP